jgi:hypothetical protein
MMTPTLTCDSFFRFGLFGESSHGTMFHFLREISCTHSGNFIKLNWLWYLLHFLWTSGLVEVMEFFWRIEEELLEKI